MAIRAAVCLDGVSVSSYKLSSNSASNSNNINNFNYMDIVEHEYEKMNEYDFENINECFKYLYEMKGSIDGYKDRLNEIKAEISMLEKSIQKVDEHKVDEHKSYLERNGASVPVVGPPSKADIENYESNKERIDELNQEYDNTYIVIFLLEKLQKQFMQEAFDLCKLMDDYDEVSNAPLALEIASFSRNPDSGMMEFYDADGALIEDVSKYEIGLYFGLNFSGGKLVIEDEYTQFFRNLSDEDKKLAAYLVNSGNYDKLDDLYYLKVNEVHEKIGKEAADEILSKIESIYAAAEVAKASNQHMDIRDVDSWGEFGEYVVYLLGEAAKGVYSSGGTVDIPPDVAADQAVLLLLSTNGFFDGLKSFFEGFDNLINADGIVDPSAYKIEYLLRGLEEKFGEDTLKTILATGSYEISSSMGNMAIPMVISTVTGCPALGTALMGISAGGNARELGLQSGMDQTGAWIYAVLVGGSEAILERFIGGIPVLSDLNEFAKGVGIKAFLASIVSEGGEEALQSILEPIFAAICHGDLSKVTFDWNEVLKSGIYGMITAGFLNTPKAVAGLGVVQIEINGVTYELNKATYYELLEKYKGKDLTNPLTLNQLVDDISEHRAPSAETVVESEAVVDGTTATSEFAETGAVSETSFDTVGGEPTTVSDTGLVDSLVETTSKTDIVETKSTLTTTDMRNSLSYVVNGVFNIDVAKLSDKSVETLYNNLLSIASIDGFNLDMSKVNEYNDFISKFFGDLKIDGIGQEHSFKTTKAKENDVLNRLRQKFKGYTIESFEKAVAAFPRSVYEFSVQQYKEAVANFKTGGDSSETFRWNSYSLAKMRAIKLFEMESGVSFESLSLKEQTDRIADIYKEFKTYTDSDKEQYLQLHFNEYVDALVSDTIVAITKLQSDGKLLPGITVDAVLRMIQDDVSPAEYLTPEAILEWKLTFLQDSTAPPGYVYTYTFQPESQGILSFGGAVGRPKEGAFSTSESQFKSIMENSTVFDENGVCKNTAALTEITGGVQFSSGNIVVIKQMIPIEALMMPTGNLAGVFTGDWHPGGFTSGGAIEAMTPNVLVNPSTANVSNNKVTANNVANINGKTYNVFTEIVGYNVNSSNVTISSVDMIKGIVNTNSERVKRLNEVFKTEKWKSFAALSAENLLLVNSIAVEEYSKKFSMSADLVDKTIKNIDKLIADGKILGNVTAYDILRMLTDGIAPEVFVDASALNEWNMIMSGIERELVLNLINNGRTDLVSGISDLTFELIKKNMMGYTDKGKNVWLETFNKLTTQQIQVFEDCMKFINSLDYEFKFNEIGKPVYENFTLSSGEIILQNELISKIVSYLNDMGINSVDGNFVLGLFEVAPKLIGNKKNITVNSLNSMISSLLSNLFFNESIFSGGLLQLNDIVDISKSLFGDDLALIDIVNNKSNSEILAGKLNNFETRVLYNYNECCIIRPKYESHLSSSVWTSYTLEQKLDLASQAYEDRASLRANSQQLTIGTNTLPKSGTNPMMTTFEGGLVDKALKVMNSNCVVNDSLVDVYFNEILSNPSIPSSIKTVIDLSNNSIEILMENISGAAKAGKISVDDIKLFYSLLVLEPKCSDILSVAAFNLISSSYRSNVSVNSVFGIVGKYTLKGGG